MPFYRLGFDHTIQPQWFLSEPTDEAGQAIDARAFTEGRSYTGPRPRELAVLQQGLELDFSFGPFDMPVVRREIGATFESLCGLSVERFPVHIAGVPGFEVLNVASALDCFDYANSVYTLWPEGGKRPEKAGELRMVLELRIDPERVGNAHLFRVDGWPIALIASSSLKERLEGTASGLTFAPV
ncbi:MULTISPECIES: DUF1629 domain-containing protein [unclassified Devosia]|jgi:hypothetical protein|uniref:imm11 family protein n=1 Tax=unclassified Devosia TaxID=196773 RepID=UPI00086ED610|nr:MULTISPECIES: DUF1629 domain-containing protein [unclassified Devosia]MBN9360419.1 hypothetical protein [Devosia sp.]ODS95983.1 MAG: hypothetical protein ABS47_01775 [Devosia sp. SCN 66-27]OJX22427.1 MAG: hypothetical protein BGO83_16520 [Devosia sp. 66-14]